MSARRGLCVLSGGGGILFTTASSTSSMPMPCLADVRMALLQSIPTTSSTSLFTFSTSAPATGANVL